MTKNWNVKIVLIVIVLIGLVSIAIGTIDVTNIDNSFYQWVNHLLGQSQIRYFDIPFLPTILSLLGTIGVLLSVYASFFILREQQKEAEKTTRLAHQPFVRISSQIRFKPDSFDPPCTSIENIGAGPALFVRISFNAIKPDNPDNAILRSDQPHSAYLRAKSDSPTLFFDQRCFYRFVTGTERGGELGSDPNRLSDPGLLKELNDLIRINVNTVFYIYIHFSDIMGNPMISKAKYLLMNESIDQNYPLFCLKRMEIGPIKGFVISRG